MVFIKCMDVETVSAYTMYFSLYKIVFYNYMYMSIYANELVNKNFVQNINLYEKYTVYILHVPLVLFIL